MLKLFHENLAHAGDKLIKSKCVALINKGPQQTSVSVPVDPQSVAPTTKQDPVIQDNEEDTPDADQEEETPEDN